MLSRESYVIGLRAPLRVQTGMMAENTMDISGFIILFSVIAILLLTPVFIIMTLKDKAARQNLDERIKNISKMVNYKSGAVKPIMLKRKSKASHYLSGGNIFLLLFLPIPPLFVVLFSSSLYSAITSIVIYFALIGFFIMMLLKIRRMRYRKAFVGSLPNSIDLVIRSLRAGRTITDSIKTVGLETKGPVADQFINIIDQVELGKDFIQVVKTTASKINIPEFSFFVIVLSVQHETGGNVIKTLSSLANMLRQRQMMLMKIKALSSEGIFSAIFMGSLPLFVIGVIHLMRPEYLALLFTTSTGHHMLIYAVLSEIIGCSIIFRMVRIDV